MKGSKYINHNKTWVQFIMLPAPVFCCMMQYLAFLIAPTLGFVLQENLCFRLKKQVSWLEEKLEDVISEM